MLPQQQWAGPARHLRLIARPSPVVYSAARWRANTAIAENASIAPESSASSFHTFRQQLTGQLEEPHSSASPNAGVADARIEDWHPSQGWKLMSHHLSKEELWQRIRQEVKLDANLEPSLASFFHSTILEHKSLERSMAFLLANKLSSPTLLGTQLMRLIQDAYLECPDIVDAGVADIQAVFDRDPACEKYATCMLYFKGFQALQCHRLAHWLAQKGRMTLALALQSRVSEVFHVDIHPSARIGRGVMLDHATGIVIGETARVGDNVSMLHHVTLGGSGLGKGIRHPDIGHGVLLGAGVSVLGPVTVGAGSKVGAGSVVVSDLPSHSVAVGVPARIIKRQLKTEPCKDMDQINDFILDFVI